MLTRRRYRIERATEPRQSRDRMLDLGLNENIAAGVRRRRLEPQARRGVDLTQNTRQGSSLPGREDPVERRCLTSYDCVRRYCCGCPIIAPNISNGLPLIVILPSGPSAMA